MVGATKNGTTPRDFNPQIDIIPGQYINGEN